MRTSRRWIALAGAALIGVGVSPSFGQQNYGQTSTAKAAGQNQKAQSGQYSTLETQARQTIKTFKQKDPSMKPFFRKSAGYAVFPAIGEGAFVVGSSHGKGIVFEHGKPVGETTMTSASIGAQVGGKSFSEIIFFQNPQTLQSFKQGNYQFSAGIGAVAASSSAARQINYRNGVAVFTTSGQGLMAKASVGGQKFSYQPLPGQAREMGGGGVSAQSGTSTGSGRNTQSQKNSSPK